MDSIALIEKYPQEDTENRDITIVNKRLHLKSNSTSSSESVIVKQCYPCLANFQYVLSFLGIVIVIILMAIMLVRMFTPTPRE